MFWKYFFREKKNIEEQDKHFYACMHHGPTWIHLEMMFVIGLSIRMCELKYIWALSRFIISIANEGCHVRI